MKIEKLSTNKIKVTLSNEDMNQWELNFENLTYNSPQVQELFWSVMKKAEDELGFIAENAQLMVEAMPTKTEGFIMIVSKVDEEPTDLAKHIKTRLKRTEIKVRRKTKSTVQPLIYEFMQFDDAVSACRLIRELFDGYSIFYKYQDRYYLSMCCVNGMEERIKNNLTEYGERKAYAAVFEGKLVEYGKILIPHNAVEMIYSYFK